MNMYFKLQGNNYLILKHWSQSQMMTLCYFRNLPSSNLPKKAVKQISDIPPRKIHGHVNKYLSKTLILSDKISVCV